MSKGFTWGLNSIMLVSQGLFSCEIKCLARLIFMLFPSPEAACTLQAPSSFEFHTGFKAKE